MYTSYPHEIQLFAMHHSFVQGPLCLQFTVAPTDCVTQPHPLGCSYFGQGSEKGFCGARRASVVLYLFMIPKSKRSSKYKNITT